MTVNATVRDLIVQPACIRNPGWTPPRFNTACKHGLRLTAIVTVPITGNSCPCPMSKEICTCMVKVYCWTTVIKGTIQESWPSSHFSWHSLCGHSFSGPLSSTIATQQIWEVDTWCFSATGGVFAGLHNHFTTQISQHRSQWLLYLSFLKWSLFWLVSWWRTSILLFLLQVDNFEFPLTAR
jgi:hypothetical protein